MVIQDIFYHIQHGNIVKVRDIIYTDYDIHTVNEYSRTPLLQACRFGHRDIALLLLHHGANINDVDERGCTALMYAIWSGKIRLVRSLIYYGVDYNMCSQLKVSPLMCACMADDVIMIREMLLYNNVNQRDSNGKTALHYAVQTGDELMLDTLIQAGGDVMARTNIGDTILDHAVMFENVELMHKLIGLSVPLSEHTKPQGQCKNILTEALWYIDKNNINHDKFIHHNFLYHSSIGNIKWVRDYVEKMKKHHKSSWYRKNHLHASTNT